MDERERDLPHDPGVLAGDDEPPRMPETTSDPYRPHMRDRQPWAGRWRILLWAWIPVIVIVGAVVWAHYR